LTAPASLSLLLTRLSFGAFLAIWGGNKLTSPEGTEGIFAKYYGIESLGTLAATGMGVAQIALGVVIMAGLFRTVSYGIGTAVHGASTIATFPHLIAPLAEGSNLIFWSGVPILFAALGLFLARYDDTLCSLDMMRKKSAGPAPQQS